MSKSEIQNDIERKLREKAAAKAAALFAGYEIHQEEDCPARIEFGLGVTCALHPEPKPTQLKKVAISCAIAATTSLAITLAIAAPASSAQPVADNVVISNTWHWQEKDGATGKNEATGKADAVGKAGATGGKSTPAPTPSGPSEDNRLESSSVGSPKVGVATQPTTELVEEWREELDQKLKDANIKGPKGSSIPSTLTRAQTVGLTAWMLGDWSTFDGEYGNGKVPEENLKQLLTVNNHELRHDAAIMFDLMAVDFLEEFGHPISLTDSYRSYELQVSVKARKPNLAATPGTSNHGWGLAVDLSGPESRWETPERQWLLDNGWKYGWFSPTWAQQGGTRPEAWHFEYMGTTEIAWPKEQKILGRLDELNGDPLQGLFAEDIIQEIKELKSETPQVSGKNGSKDSDHETEITKLLLKARQKAEALNRDEERQTGSVILNQPRMPRTEPGILD